MVRFRLAVGFAMVFAFTACGSDPDATSATVMPEVLGLQLDVALSDIERAGFQDEVEILGGGAFGVVDESNWTVCGQLPEAGGDMNTAPRLTVDRSCEGDAAEQTSPPTTPKPTTPLTTPEPSVSEPPPTVTTDEESVSGESEAAQVLTVENSEDLAALLNGPECSDDTIAAFAAQYRDMTIKFEGHISNLQNHGDNDTRYDILLNTGDFSETTLAGIQNGPNFKFEDVNIAELNLTGPDVTDSITTGDNLTVTASIEEWNGDNCLFFLDPVATEMR